ncbi:MAG: DUF2007 domain-containing protein [Deltaproteobacteria bacterium]|nr:DUF2007 domain-containing protein [Deltaproteobacteria bacterium]MBI3017838.1 DUF2007 domain-containing protein [Deltaproteobacteria bacterium]
MEDLVCIKIFNNKVEAEMAKQLLENNDIPTRMLSDDVGGMEPHLRLHSGGVKLLVSKSNSQKALSLLGEAK